MSTGRVYPGTKPAASARMDLFADLMNLQARAADDGKYEVAYHCLMAALHMADDQGDLNALDEVDVAVKDVGTTIEAISPPHLLSRAMAEKRGQPPLIESMSAHVSAVRARLHAAAARAKQPLPAAR